jgi:hypothetical protein
MVIVISSMISKSLMQAIVSGIFTLSFSEKYCNCLSY